MQLGLTPELYLGQPISKLNTTQDFPWLDSTSQQALKNSDGSQMAI